MTNNVLDITLIRADDIKPQPIQWIWDGWLARGKLHILAGQAGAGKTTIAIELAAIISDGGKFPDGSNTLPGSILIWSGEDSVEDTLVPRLAAANANLGKVYFISDVVSVSRNSKRTFDPSIDMANLIARAESIPDLTLIVLDPIVSAVTNDSHKNGEVRRALQPIVDFGIKRNCAVLGITHFSKGGQGKNILERVTGSIAFGALARVVLAAGKIVGEDSDKRILCRTKNNIGDDTGGFEYSLREIEIESGIYTSRIEWGSYQAGNSNDLLAPPASTNSGDCVDFLKAVLVNGKVSVKDIIKAGLDNGFSFDQLKRAKQKLKIKSHREGFGKGATIFWVLPTTNILKISGSGTP